MERAMKQAAKAKDASPHWVFTFGAGRAEGDAAQRDLLGGKGAYLAEMSRLGLRVPPGLTISYEVCAAYYQADKTPPEDRPLTKVGRAMTRSMNLTRSLPMLSSV